MNDYLVKATTYEGMVRAYAATTTATVAEAQRRQDTWATASAALGRTITITALMGAMYKGEDSLTAKIEGNGPLGVLVADGNAKGEVRGYVTNPHVDFDLNDQGKLDVARAVGTEGNLSVVKDLGWKEDYTGLVPIFSAHISEYFNYYFANTEQISSTVGASVLVTLDHSIFAECGFTILVISGADKEIITRLDEQIQTNPDIST